MEYSFLFSLLTTGLVQLFKSIPQIPLTEGQQSKTRKVVVVLSFIGGLAGAYLDGSLSQPDVSKMYVDIITSTITTYAMAHGWYAGVLKKPENPENQ